MSEPDARPRSGPAWDVALAALAAGLVALRAWKTHAAGIVFDEALSFLTFGTPEVALTSYEYPNNHVLNSLLIALSNALLPGYEHGIRLHSFLASVVFTVAAALSVRRLLQRPWLRLLGLALLGSNAFLFDLSFLARGYALALAATTACLVPLLRWSERGLSRSASWRLPVLLVAVNVVTLGSMISAAPFVASLNLVVLLVLARRLVPDAPASLAWRLRLVLATAVPSLLVLHLLYRRLYGPILAWDREFGMRPPGRFLRQLLLHPLAGRGDAVARAALALLALVGLVLLVQRLRGRAAARPTSGAFPDAGPRAPLALLVLPLAGTAVLLALQRLLGVSLGFPRNESFLLPWLWLLGLAGLERGLEACGDRQRRLLSALAAAALAVLCLRDRASPDVVEIARFDVHSAGGPLLRELRALDPERTWRVGLSPEDGTRYLALVFDHYRRFGHRVEYTLDPRERTDVLVRELDEGAPAPVEDETLFEPRRFAAFGCRVRLAP